MIKKTHAHAHALHNLVFIGPHRDLLDSSFTHFEYLELILLAFSLLFILIEGSRLLVVFFLVVSFPLNGNRKEKQNKKQRKKRKGKGAKKN
jgi:hypothetical protein